MSKKQIIGIAIFIYRFFCRFFCPLGAIYGLFNKLSILGVKVDKSKCNSCGACVSHCKMDVKEVGDYECIQCGDCMKVCGCKAIKWKMISKIIKEDEQRLETNEIKSATVDEVNKKKVFKISKKSFNVITYTFMLVTLTLAITLSNLGSKTYKTYDVVDNLTITLNDNYDFDITKDTNATLLYFFNDTADLDYDKLNSYANEKLNIILLASTDLGLNEFDEIIGLEYLKVIHLNDSKNVCGAHKDRHENLGHGHIGFDNLCKIAHHDLLKDIPIILETPYIDDKAPYKEEIKMIRNKTFINIK